MAAGDAGRRGRAGPGPGTRRAGARGSGEAVTAAARAENFDPDELGGLAALTGNPVPALARALARQVPQTAASAVHRGATSQDIMDTAAMLLARRAIDVIAGRPGPGGRGRGRAGRAHRATIMIGRTLLQQAVPVTFGLVAAGWLTSLDEARAGLAAVGSQRLAVQFGGAAGTLASLGDAGPRVAALLAEELGLAAPVLPWHTDRLRIIDLAAALARVAAALGKIARDVTLLAQSEVGEVSEGGGEPGPAAMPRRRAAAAPRRCRTSSNPVAAIAILGCTRQVPGLLATLVAGAEQELQRAAGAWHAEWEPLTALLAADRLGRELGGRAAGRARSWTPRGWPPTWPRPRACRSPSTSPRCWPACSAAPRRTTWWPRRASGR